MARPLNCFSAFALIAASAGCARVTTERTAPAHLATVSTLAPGERAALIIAAYGAAFGITYYVLNRDFTDVHPTCNCRIDATCHAC